MGWLRERFGERSTYNGLGFISVIAGILAGPEAVQSVAPVAGMLYGVYEASRAEK